MKKSATEVMQDVLYAAVIDGIVALKAASKGLPNNLLRDLNAIHANTTQADLPPDLQASIAASVRTAFTKLLKEGYSVAPGTGQPPRPHSGPGGPGGGGHGRGPGGGERRPQSRSGPRREGSGPGRPGRAPRGPGGGGAGTPGGGDRPKRPPRPR